VFTFLRSNQTYLHCDVTLCEARFCPFFRCRGQSKLFKVFTTYSGQSKIGSEFTLYQFKSLCEINNDTLSHYISQKNKLLSWSLQLGGLTIKKGEGSECSVTCSAATRRKRQVAFERGDRQVQLKFGPLLIKERQGKQTKS
jgi:hypothetical protein